MLLFIRDQVSCDSQQQECSACFACGCPPLSIECIQTEGPLGGGQCRLHLPGLLAAVSSPLFHRCGQALQRGGLSLPPHVPQGVPSCAWCGESGQEGKGNQSCAGRAPYPKASFLWLPWWRLKLFWAPLAFGTIGFDILRFNQPQIKNTRDCEVATVLHICLFCSLS